MGSKNQRRLAIERLEDRTVPSLAAPINSPGPHAGSGDFNNDGRADLVAIDTASKAVSVRLGNGDGTFQAPRASAALVNPKSLTVGDFNNDGKLDVVAVTSAGTSLG